MPVRTDGWIDTGVGSENKNVIVSNIPILSLKMAQDVLRYKVVDTIESPPGN